MVHPGRHGWPAQFSVKPGLYGADDFINRHGPLTASTHGQTPWRGLTTPTNAAFRPASLLGRLGLGIGSLGAGLMTYMEDAGRGSDLTGMDPGYMLEGMVDPTWGLPDSPGWGLRPGAVLGGNNPYMGGTPPATSVEPELDANTRALIDFDMEQNRQTMGLDPAPYGANPVLQSLSTP